jgi:hypothetical protein
MEDVGVCDVGIAIWTSSEHYFDAWVFIKT